MKIQEKTKCKAEENLVMQTLNFTITSTTDLNFTKIVTENSCQTYRLTALKNQSLRSQEADRGSDWTACRVS